MLIEIFNSRIFEETVSEHPEDSKKVPSCTITETGEMVDRYKIVRDFIINSIDSARYPIKHGGYYMLEIEAIYPTSSITCVPEEKRQIKFEFKFEYTNTSNKVIHGSVYLNTYLNEVMYYARDYLENEGPFAKAISNQAPSTQEKG